MEKRDGGRSSREGGGGLGGKGARVGNGKRMGQGNDGARTGDEGTWPLFPWPSPATPPGSCWRGSRLGVAPPAPFRCPTAPLLQAASCRQPSPAWAIHLPPWGSLRTLPREAGDVADQDSDAAASTRGGAEAEDVRRIQEVWPSGSRRTSTHRYRNRQRAGELRLRTRGVFGMPQESIPSRCYPS